MKFRFFILILLVLSLVSACAPRGVILVNPAAKAIGDLQTVFYGTTRARSNTGYAAQRSMDIQFGKYEISIPPAHNAGKIEWPTKKPDPKRFFVAAGETSYSSTSDFTAALSKTLRALPSKEREVVVYVHGYNTNFAEGLFRLAQLSEDFELSKVAVHYSWPSAARTLGYGHDRDSMLFARDGLEELLGAVQKSGAKRVLLVGHSLGALLVMETLRQAALENRLNLHKNLLSVVLISPDIDIELFRKQAARIKRLPQPFVIFTSQKDRALRISAMLSGQKERLGSVSDANELAGLDVTLLDVSSYSMGGLGHFTPATSPTLINILSQMNKIDAAFRNRSAPRKGAVMGSFINVETNATIINAVPE
ncbi:MAG: alpha/beta fold hydrolase [Rhodobacterales bacterium]|nr:alpha/beta fold hydrolase [Rhodobacterales bacterium]